MGTVPRRPPPKPEPAPSKLGTPAERDEPVKINLDFEDALRGLMEVDPDAEPVEDDRD